MAGYNDPKLLYAIKGINAYHIEHGKEECLTPSGPQTLSLLMVPTSTPFYDHSSTDGYSQAPEEDFYLHLHLPPELDLPLPATTQIYHQPPSSYLIPRAWDLGPERGAFTRIEFPGIGKGGSQDDVDTFETILAQCTAFLERAPPPKPKRPHKSKGAAAEPLPPYDPSTFKPGEGYVQGSASSHTGGQIVLVDEENGSVIGELGEGYSVVEDSKLQAGSKDPVEITLPEDGSMKIGVAPASPRYLKDIPAPYKNSTIVTKAAVASRLIITGSDYISKTLQEQAENFTRTTKPNAKPMSFTPTTHERIRKVHSFSAGAAGVSASAVNQVNKYAQNISAHLLKRGPKAHHGTGPDGKPIEGYQPGLLNKSLMAFSTIADGVNHAGQSLLASSSTAVTKVVTHKYGPEAGEVSKSIGGGVMNVALVYIDATGVSRKAIIKSMAKGMLIGKVSGGGHVIVPGTDDAPVNAPATATATAPATRRVPSALEKPTNWKEKEAVEGRYTYDDPVMTGEFPLPPTYENNAGDDIEEQKYYDSKDIWK